MNLKELAKARGTNLKRVAEDAGIPPSTLYAISQGSTSFDNVGVSMFIRVADALGITVEQLHELPSVPPEKVEPYLAVLGEEPKGEPSGEGLSPEARELAGIYMGLDERGRSMLLASARALAGDAG